MERLALLKREQALLEAKRPMYHFAIVALVALGCLKLVDFVSDNIPQLERLRSLLVLLVALTAMWILDYSMFEGFGVAVQNHAVGVWVTGFITAGLTVPWRALFRFLTHDKVLMDESLGEHRPLVRKAA